MALSTYSGDTNYISQLSDQPNDTDGLSADDLKAVFDQFGTEFKAFFNEQHLPEVESAINAAASGIPVGDVDANILIDGSITSDKLKQTPGSQAVTTATIRNKAVIKAKLSDEVQEAIDAVAGKASFIATTVTLTVAGWSSNTQTKTVQGVTTGNVIIATGANTDISFYAWGNCGIHVAAQSTNSLTFKCRTVPSTSVVVNILILN